MIGKVALTIAVLTVAAFTADGPPKRLQFKLDLCHNGAIVPLGVHGASKVETVHGMFDPVTHVFTARVDTPGHEGDTVVRYYAEVDGTELDLYVNPEMSCVGAKAPDTARNVYVEVCVDGKARLFEGSEVKDLQADADAFVTAGAVEKRAKLGTDCIPITTTTTLVEVRSPENGS